jgi:hypothetical protein
MQVRPRGTNLPPYAPNRDLINIFRHACSLAFHGLGDANWRAWMGSYLDHHQVTDEQLGRAAQALCEFFQRCCQMDDKLAGDSLKKSGFLDAPTPVQLVVMAAIGDAMTGLFWACIRDAQPANHVPAGALELSLAAADLVRRSQWRRSNPPTVLGRAWIWLKEHIWKPAPLPPIGKDGDE